MVNLEVSAAKMVEWIRDCGCKVWLDVSFEDGALSSGVEKCEEHKG